MNTVLSATPNTASVPASRDKRSVVRLLAPLNQLAENSPHFLSKSFGQFHSAGQTYSLPRYVYLGPKGGGDTIRIGVARLKAEELVSSALPEHPTAETDPMTSARTARIFLDMVLPPLQIREPQRTPSPGRYIGRRMDRLDENYRRISQSTIDWLKLM
jgi:hypothetical protein